MIAKWLKYMSNVNVHDVTDADGADAILIADKHGVIEYSAMFSERNNRMMYEDFIGKTLPEVYPCLTKETSSHCRVMQTGQPILNEKQHLTDFRGNSYNLISSTFPLEYQGEIIGTIEVSSFCKKNGQLDREGNHSSSPDKGLYVLDDIITKDTKVIELKTTIAKVAQNLSSVLIWGETGTGKELFAQAVHSHSPRASGPFISQNCAAIPTTLLESTLFGTVKGSFTGAENKNGLLKLADGGTLFLDEINSMDLSLQAKILKAIEEKSFRKVGGERDIHTNVRIVSAMNVDPMTAVQDGILRKDLFYRLGVVQIHLPPLRKRPDDILLLTDFLVRKYNCQMGRNIQGVSELVENALLNYEWPGNVRELRNMVESAFNLCSGDVIQLNDIPSYIIYSDGARRTLSDEIDSDEELGLLEAVHRYEKNMICKALDSSKNVTEAARKLKLTRQALQYKMMKYQLN